MSKRALITGVAGQDGSWLAEFLLSKDYDVYGLSRWTSTGDNLSNIKNIKTHPRFHLVVGDILDYGFMTKLISDVQPDEMYSLASCSHVGYSFNIPTEVFRVNAEAVMAQLDIIRNFSKKTKFYNAATSELLGGVSCPETGYDETSPIDPQSPYATAKSAAFYAVKNYRKAYGLFACSGILFNHSSTRRPPDFASRKITQGIAKIVMGQEKKLKMGNISASRDEGNAEDFVQAMWLMLQQEKPDDYVVATGVSTTIEEMIGLVCKLAGRRFEDVYEQDPAFMRPSDVQFLKGNPNKIKQLGWEPKKYWEQTLTEMFYNDIDLLKAKI